MEGTKLFALGKEFVLPNSLVGKEFGRKEKIFILKKKKGLAPNKPPFGDEKNILYFFKLFLAQRSPFGDEFKKK